LFWEIKHYAQFLLSTEPPVIVNTLVKPSKRFAKKMRMKEDTAIYLKYEHVELLVGNFCKHSDYLQRLPRALHNSQQNFCKDIIINDFTFAAMPTTSRRFYFKIVFLALQNDPKCALRAISVRKPDC